MKIIHLTDTHITKAGVALYGVESINPLRQAIADINQHHSDADFCLITGDLTHYGDDEAFEHLKTGLADLQIPLHLMIGNHDHRERAKVHFPEHFKTDENGFLQQVIDTPKGKFILTDTVRQGEHIGEYCTKRQAWLAQQLDAYADDTVYICTHHAPFKTGLKALDTIGINQSDAAAMANIVRGRNNIKHWFMGHYHRPMSGQWLGIPFSCLRSLMLQASLDFTTTDKMLGKHEQPQYCVVLLEDDKTVVHYHDFADTSEVHDTGYITE